tara:strand:- start:187 stop:441 length:255 start_codon:yes stop_codon:yes gene_type:complete
LATSANSEQLAFRFNAIRGGRQDFQAIRFGIVVMITKDPGPDTFPRKGKGDLYDPSVVTGNAISQVGDVLNLKDKFVMIGIRLI